MNSKKVILKSFLFYILTYFLTIVIAMILQNLNKNVLLSTLPQLAPGITAILMILIFEAKNFPKIMKERFSFDYKSKYPIILISIIPAILISLSLFIFKMIFNVKVDKNNIILFTLIWPIIGALSEEIGWRGYFLEIIGKKANIFISSFIVGMFWFLWHAYLLGNGILFALVGFILILSNSFILSFAYYKSSKSIIVVYLFHLFLNIFTFIFISNYFYKINFLIIMTLFYFLIAAVLVIFNKKFYFSKNE